MKDININFGNIIGDMKIMHAVNNGPVWKATPDQRITNIDSYTEAGFPYARNHDASFFSHYGGDHTVDVHMIFPDFDKDPYDPASYDFFPTDEYCQLIQSTGTKVFYRLGSKIEHSVKKYGTLPPKDFKKWAVICEHIIKHLNYGWADGLHLGIEYWEIWNEPDLDSDDSNHKRTWGGTKQQFFEFYDIAATHLKEKFPELKIGGPAVCGNWQWIEDFLKQLKAPLDFFSWHIYAKDPETIRDWCGRTREMLDKYGFENSESILNEWNYVTGWENEEFIYSLKALKKLEGSAFVASTISLCQHTSLDMLMYYDAQPGYWSMYDPIIYNECQKNYYPFKMFNTLYKLKKEAELTAGDNIYGLAAKGENEAAVMLTHFNKRSEGEVNTGRRFVDIKGLDIGKKITAEIYLLDEDKDLELVRREVFFTTDFAMSLEFTKYASYLIKFKGE